MLVQGEVVGSGGRVGGVLRDIGSVEDGRKGVQGMALRNDRAMVVLKRGNQTKCLILFTTDALEGDTTVKHCNSNSKTSHAIVIQTIVSLTI